MKNNVQKLVFTAMFAALACVATMVIKVPTLGTNGYVNIGDTIVLISAWLLKNPYGVIAAGFGSALADILSGYVVYAPGTFIIKALMAFLACIIYNVLSKKAPKVVAFIISGIVAEVVMIAGYLVYEAFLLGYGVAAVTAVPSNGIQGGTCLALGLLLIIPLSKVPYVKTLTGDNK